MSRDVIAFQVPSLLKLSEVIKHFETFGDITKAAVDEKRRISKPYVNVFLSYGDRIGASRALAAGSVEINGLRIRIERSETKLEFGPKETNNFQIIRKDNASSHDDTSSSQQKRPFKRIKFN